MTVMIPAWVDGVLTPVEKLEVHRKGLKHKAISVFVMDGTKVLIQQRALVKYHTPGLWANTCCTHPDWGEEPGDCAVRRLKEELGIEGLTPVHRDRLEYRADVGDGLIEHEVVDVYLAEASADLATPLNPEEVQAVEWIELSELCEAVRKTPEKFTPWLRIYLAEYMDRIFADLADA
mgnify:FL=1